MKNVLTGLKPERVLYYFETISNIVRGSSHEKPMSDYLVAFAKERGFEVWQDHLYNILIKAPGTAGGENAQPVVLHGHMDMVWSVADGVEHDFFTDPLDLYIEDGFVKARGTTLGADNGIGVAYMLALMETDETPHPPLECVITVMEEMGKKGLEIFDVSNITAKRMIDFNWIDDKQILAGCSGDVSLKVKIPTAWEAAPQGWVPMAVTISGLKGGHCEWDIHKQRANSIVLMSRLLGAVQKKFDIRLANLEGGVQNNVIPKHASAQILVQPADVEAVTQLVNELAAAYKNEYAIADPRMQFNIATTAEYPQQVFGETAARQINKLVHLMPHDLLSINLKVKADGAFDKMMVSSGTFPTETNNNLGILRTEGDEVWMINTITSAVTSRKHDVVDRIESLVELIGAGAAVERFGVDAPEFPHSPDSVMVQLAEEAYRESYGFQPKRHVDCCSLQLGMLIQKKGLDCVGLGTEIFDVHSPRERMNLESVAKTWDMTLNFMQRLCRA